MHPQYNLNFENWKEWKYTEEKLKQKLLAKVKAEIQ